MNLFVYRGQSSGRDAILTKIEPYFDRDFYLSRYPDVAAAKIDPVVHYVDHGWREWRDPSPTFDTRFYVDRYFSDSDAQVCPLLHYAEEGAAAGHATSRADIARTWFSARDNALSDDIETLLDRMGLRAPALDSAHLHSFVLPMFSAGHYRRLKGLDDTVSDSEALIRYIAFDLRSGMPPGPLFDEAHYLRELARLGLQGPKPGEPPFLHWIDRGIPARVSPHPLYSEETYLSLHSDLREPTAWPGWAFEHFLMHGLSEARRFFPLLSFPEHATYAVSHTAKPRVVEFFETIAAAPGSVDELQRMERFRRSDLFRDLVARALAFDPEVGVIDDATTQLVPPFHDVDYASFASVRDLIPPGDYRDVVLMPFCKLGGADFIAGCLAHSIGAPEKVLVIRTDQSDWARPDWFPETITTVDLSRHLAALPEAMRTRCLYELLRELAPDRVFNMNSRLAFDTYVRYGPKLALFTKIYAYYFCADVTEDGVEVGYPVWYFANILPALDAAITDSAALAERLAERYGLSGALRDKVRVAYTPAMTPAPKTPVAARQVETAKTRRRPLLLWGGRFDRQKRFDLLVAIARALPEVDFACWGRAVLDAAPDMRDLPGNLACHPPFKRHEELPLRMSDGWLYTSAWDGLPTVLIECGALGLPIVASDVGGVRELIDDATGWLVRKPDDVAEYVRQIEAMLGAPEERVRRAAALQSRVRSRHTMLAYRNAITGAVQKEASVA